MPIGDMWHRTKVYFGLADDDSFYDDDDEDGSVAHDELEERYRRRPNVSKLESRRGSPRIDDIFADDDAPLRRRIRENTGGATTVLRPAEAGAMSDDMPKVYLSIPRAFNDAQPIADRFKRGVPVILNLQTVDTGLAKRLIDFASGLTYALEGRMQRIADKVFLLTPENVELSAEDRARYLEGAFFNQA